MATTQFEIPVTFGFNSKNFDLVRVQQNTPVGTGYIQTLERTTPMWSATYNSPPLSDDRYDSAIGFLLGLRGSMNTFLAYDPRRPMPRAYQGLPLTANPWTQSGFTAPRVVEFNYGEGSLTLDRMANGAIITPGDYISLQVAGIWYLFRAITKVVASSNQAQVHVEPQPFLPEGMSPTNIRYRKACAEMKQVGKFKETDSVDGGVTLSFSAVQFINRSEDAADTDTPFHVLTESGFIIGTEGGDHIDWRP